jgi:hypothetical protein
MFDYFTQRYNCHYYYTITTYHINYQIGPVIIITFHVPRSNQSLQITATFIRLPIFRPRLG